jgi:hypothetical protein
MRVLVVAVLFLFVFCNRPETNTALSRNAESFGCRALLALPATEVLSKSATLPPGVMKTDTVTYCAAERLYWVYDSVTGNLHLLLTRIFFDCASQVVLEVTKNNDSLFLLPNEKVQGSTICDCPIDVYCDFPWHSTDSLTLTFSQHMIGPLALGINPLKGHGVFVIDTGGSAACRRP